MKQKIEEYLNNKIKIEELVHYFDTNNYTEEEIKKNGIVYTPKKTSDYIVSILNPTLKETVFEPSVGHGIFIFSLLDFIENKYNLSSSDLKKYLTTKVYFEDIQEENILELNKILEAYFKKKEIILKRTEINYKIGDTLKENFNIKFNIILGNPPYIRIKNLNKENIEFLRKNFSSCEKGNIDIYYAFIQFAIENSNRSSFITPNSWIYNKSAEKLRELVKNNLNILIDFKVKKIFSTADTYTSIFLHNNIKSNEFLHYKEDFDKKTVLFNKKDINNNRWLFYKEDNKKLNINIIKYHTPIATLRDKIFINHNLKENNNEDIVNFYKISTIKTEKEFLETKSTIIFPYYLNNVDKFIIKKESELNIETKKYLHENKEELLKRDKGKQEKYEEWFCYGRRQGLNIYKNNSYLIIIPGMIIVNNKFFAIESNKIKKPFLFSSGFILEVDKDNKNKLLDYLNSKDFNYLLKNEGKVWEGSKGKENYYSLSITQLKKIFNN